MATSDSALSGIRVIELGTFISAPFAGTLLADFGADVIKIELPDVGDPMRTLGQAPEESDSSYWWSVMGRNKRSVCIDVRTNQGRVLLARLLETTDVVVENFRPGTLERWGIGPDWLKKHSPELILLRISGYGQDGPARDMPGLDRNAQAFSSLVYVTGDKSTPPVQAGLPINDYAAGLWGAFGVLAAIIGRLRHGAQGGNEIDLALYEATLPFLKDIPTTYQREGKIAERSGNTPDYVAPAGTYLTGDGDWVFISGTGDRIFARLMNAIGQSQLAQTPKYHRNVDRVANRLSLDALISEWTEARTTQQVVESLEASDVPVAQVNTIGDLMSHPQTRARNNFITVPGGDIGKICFAAPIPRMHQFGPAFRWLGQSLGTATTSVLVDELGLTAAEVSALRSDGIVGGSST